MFLWCNYLIRIGQQSDKKDHHRVRKPRGEVPQAFCLFCFVLSGSPNQSMTYISKTRVVELACRNHSKWGIYSPLTYFYAMTNLKKILRFFKYSKKNNSIIDVSYPHPFPVKLRTVKIGSFSSRTLKFARRFPSCSLGSTLCSCRWDQPWSSQTGYPKLVGWWNKKRLEMTDLFGPLGLEQCKGGLIPRFVAIFLGSEIPSYLFFVTSNQIQSHQSGQNSLGQWFGRWSKISHPVRLIEVFWPTHPALHALFRAKKHRCTVVRVAFLGHGICDLKSVQCWT